MNADTGHSLPATSLPRAQRATLPDGEPNGPFATQAGALANAREE